ncbi:hypothetical protein GCM10023192_12960 [Amycolatopsis samaneae]
MSGLTLVVRWASSGVRVAGPARGDMAGGSFLVDTDPRESTEPVSRFRLGVGLSAGSRRRAHPGPAS